MKILVAEDDLTSRLILQNILVKWGYDVVVTADGNEAWSELIKEDAPPVAVLDWMMPGMDGVDICREIRKIEKPDQPLYIILLTGRDTKEDIVAGLDAGANDYITKPFDNEELRARVSVGQRVAELQIDLARNNRELRNALDHIKQLQGILPICSYCKKIRDDKNYWRQVESYISSVTEASFTHSICPDCYKTHVKPQMDEFKQWKNKKKNQVENENHR